MADFRPVSLKTFFVALLGTIALGATPAAALPNCDALPDHSAALDAISAAQAQDNGGFDLHMWITIVDRDGVVCAVAFSGEDRGEQWPGSRVISAQKANTANAFSLPDLALSTANLWAATQPGGSLFGLQFSNPVDTAVAYGDDPGDHKGSDAEAYGQVDDPMVGEILGGVNVFGGGLALYNASGTLLGALGVSGDSSCADHNIAWRARDRLGLDYVPDGVAAVGDNIIYDTVDDPPTGHDVSASGFGHPDCGGDEAAENVDIVNTECPLGNGPDNATCTP